MSLTWIKQNWIRSGLWLTCFEPVSQSLRNAPTAVVFVECMAVWSIIMLTDIWSVAIVALSVLVKCMKITATGAKRLCLTTKEYITGMSAYRSCVLPRVKLMLRIGHLYTQASRRQVTKSSIKQLSEQYSDL